MSDIVKPKLDTGFKLLFASPENENLLRSLISGLLGIDEKNIQTIQIQNGELLPEEADKKFGRIDLRLFLQMVLTNNKVINLELQIKPQDDFDDRSLFYWAKLFIADLKSGHEYSELPETICLNIINFTMFGCEEYHSHFQILEKNRHELLNDKFAIHFYELPKISKDNLEDADLMTLWLKLIDSESEEDLKMLETVKEPSIVQAVSFIRHMSADEKTRELARQEEKRLHDEASIIGTAHRQGFREGIAEGMEKGERKKTQRIAFRLFEKKKSDEDILDILDISADELEKLKTEYTNM